jgi:hypothetical protein
VLFRKKQGLGLTEASEFTHHFGHVPLIHV